MAEDLLRSDINTDIIAGPQSVSTAGVSSNGSGLATGAGVGGTAGFVIGYGPNPPNLDPSISVQASVRSLHDAGNQSYSCRHIGTGSDAEAI